MVDNNAPMAEADSINSQDPNNTPEPTKQKSRRPANTAFRQQRLKAWQPILTPKTVLPLFFAIGIIFAPLGGGLLYTSAQVQEIIIDYSNCHTDAPLEPLAASVMPDKLVTTHFKPGEKEQGPPTWVRRYTNATYGNGSTEVQVPVIQCTITFPVDHAMPAPVLFYYRLTNFYQNHRRYAKSFNTDQLSGKAVSPDSIHNSDCAPLTTVEVDGVRKPYYPCGLAANSVFNDTFSSPLWLNAQNTTAGNKTYEMKNNSGISWASDRTLYGPSDYKWEDVVVPPNWVERYPNNYSEEYHPDLENDEAFQVWMRLAGLPTFAKLFQRNDVDTMEVGTYSVDINSHFNVTEFGGTKSIIISTRTFMGGRNPFLGIAYVIVGGICIVLGALFTVTHLIKPRKLGDHTYLSWNNDQAAGATTTGRDGGDTSNA